MDIDFDNITLNGDMLEYAFPNYGNTDQNSQNSQTDVHIKWREWLLRMKAQSEHIADGYADIKDVYPALKGINGIINNETTMKTQIGNTHNVSPYLDSVTGNIDNILDGIFGNSGAERDNFDLDYNAYMAGQYYNQDKRDRDGSEFADTLTAMGFNAGDVNNPAVLNTLQSRMLNAINTAMGVNEITDAGNKARVSDMNEYLITQWQDIAQAQAVRDDIAGLGYNNVVAPSSSMTVDYFINNNGGVNKYAMAPEGKGSKAGVPGTFFGDKFLS
jgi:hypothetical protein